MSAREAGSTVISHRSLRPSTRRAPAAPPVRPPWVTRTALSRIVFQPILMGSLNRIRNAKEPESCPEGMFTKRAVSGAVVSTGVSTGAGPGMTVETAVSSRRPPEAHMVVAGSAQSALGLSRTVTSPSPAGSTSMPHKSLRPSIRWIRVSVPLAMASEWRTPFQLVESAASRPIRSEMAPLPSWLAGTFWNEAVSPVVATCSSAVVSTGPAIVASRAFDNERPSAVHKAPLPVHSRFAATLNVTSVSESGSMSSFHRSLRPSTRLPFVTSAFVTVSAWSRTAS